jgi:hypothetical protein
VAKKVKAKAKAKATPKPKPKTTPRPALAGQQGAETGESNPPSKQKKKRVRCRNWRIESADSGAAEGDAAPGVICDPCGGAAPEISLRVASLDGTTLDLTVPQRELVRGQVKRLCMS